MTVPSFFHVELTKDALVITTDPADASEQSSQVMVRPEAWGALIAGIYEAVGASLGEPAVTDFIKKYVIKAK